MGELTKEFLIKEFKRWKQNHNNKTPSRDDLKAQEGYPSGYQYVKIFGSWKNALLEIEGLTSDVKWSELEIEFLKNSFDKLGDEGIAKELGRTKNGVKYKRQELGISKPNPRHWKQWEIEYLKNNFYDTPSTEICETLDKKWDTIRSYANKQLKLKRKNSTHAEISECGKYKTCKSCSKELPNTEDFFYKDKDKRSLRAVCKECFSNNLESISRHKGTLTRKLRSKKFKEGLKYCSKCKQWLNISEFFNRDKNKEHKTHADYSAFCSKCSRVDYMYRRIGRVLIEDLGLFEYTKEDIKNIIKMIESNVDKEDIKDKFKNKSNIEYVIQNLSGYIQEARGSKGLYASNGERCLSVAELKITEIFIHNNIKYKKEVEYRELIKECKTSKRFDWKIDVNDKEYYVEYFGLWDTNSKSLITKEYVKRTKKKIKQIYKNGVIDQCIFIFPNMLKDNSLFECFQNKFNINIQLKDQILISQTKDEFKYLNLTDEELLNRVMKHSEDKNTFPQIRDLCNHEVSIFNEIIRRYGNYVDFAFRFNKRVLVKPQDWWTQEKIFEVFSYMLKKYGKIIRGNSLSKYKEDIKLDGLSTVYKECGSYIGLKCDFFNYYIDSKGDLPSLEIKWLKCVVANEGMYIRGKATYDEMELAKNILEKIKCIKLT